MKIPLRFWSALAMALGGTMLVSSCRDSAPEGANASGKPTVALVMKSLANEFFKTMAEGAEAHHAANPDAYRLISNGIQNETDLTAQVNLVEQMVSRGAQVIVIAPADSKALIPALKRAHEAGVLVVNIDNKLDAEALTQAGLSVPFVGPDNREGAKAVGDFVAAKLKPGDEVAILEGVPTAFNGVQRRLGFEDAVREAGLNLVSSQSGSWEMEKANTVAAAMLNEHPGLTAILCANDSMALGAVAAVKAARREGKVLVAGFDNIRAVEPLLESGAMVATADQHGDELAVFGIESALKIIAGEAKPQDRKTPVDLVTK